MDGNPYARMAELMQGGDGAQSVRMYLGAVAQKTPLAVNLGGIRLPAGELRISAGLDLEEGDTVLMLTENDQVFYILMKVANAV